MVLNMEQQEAVANGEPVTLNVAGTECVLVRRNVYLRLDPDYEMGPWTDEEMNLLADEAEGLISQTESPDCRKSLVNCPMKPCGSRTRV